MEYDDEKEQSGAKLVFESLIIKQPLKRLAEEEAFRFEEQFDEKEFVGRWRTLKNKPKGVWNHVKEAIFIRCMIPIESDEYVFARASEQWKNNRRVRLEGLLEDERRQSEVLQHQRAQMIRKSKIMGGYQNIRR